LQLRDAAAIDRIRASIDRLADVRGIPPGPTINRRVDPQERQTLLTEWLADILDGIAAKGSKS